ncbi:unnamed protein product, partial [Amoebophrya sp. A120]|eukprot:GSA120T00012694001.1
MDTTSTQPQGGPFFWLLLSGEAEQYVRAMGERDDSTTSNEGSGAAEWRQDPADGRFYTLAETIAFYRDQLADLTEANEAA